MNYCFDNSLVQDYKSQSQKIRIMSEAWIADNIYCPVCGNPHIDSLENNKPVADFQCNYCGEIFELKTKRGNLGRKITDGSYSTMINRITSIDNPDLFVMQYSSDLQVINLTLIPKFFFVPDIIEKRKPLAPTARRAGWVGCNILFSNIPEQGKIRIIKNQSIQHSNDVVAEYAQIKAIQTNNLESRGWIIDVLNCVNRIKSMEFSLQDIYCFVDELQHKHLDNHNIKAKIRQQLQLLRDKGFIEFLGNGHYKKIIY